MEFLTITFEDTEGEKKTAKVSYINPTATNAQLKEMAQRIVMLTTNTYISCSRTTTQTIQ